jgi:putative superfamily III holin-X
MSLSRDLNDIPKLFGDAVEQLGKLVQNEAQLARTEMSEKITQAGIGTAYLAGAAALCIPVLVMLLMALSIALIQAGLSPVAAYLASAVVAAVIAGILAAIGLNRLKPENLTPNVTIKEVGRDVASAKELAR